MPKRKAALFYDYPLTDGEVFGQGRRERIAGLTELHPEMVSAATFERHAPALAELQVEARPDLTALLDVTWPEPPAPTSKLWSLPNVVISPHIGGTTGDEVVRLADCAIEEFERWQAGQPLRYQVTREIFATMG